ncbi:class I SAM-dependent methyltransferase [Chamaesiphon sp.]|uniref:class I SAM-dependent methyltransferase n=1 Tax=Chamaesiphon sp. TaxID=2814140 RepID=UPI003593ED85
MSTDRVITPEEKDKPLLPWTGERLVTEVNDRIGTIEHLHRYAFAMEYVSNKVIVDIASGEGYGSNLLAGVASHVIGVDVSQEAIDFACQKYIKPNLEFKVGSADSIPVPDNSVDVVVSFETLEHHEKHDEMMKEIVRILKPEGLMIISTPDKSIYHRRDPDNIYHVKELDFDEFTCLVEKHFKESVFIEQKIIFGSLLSLKHSTQSGAEKLSFYSGDFDRIKFSLDLSKDVINQPYFYICLASNQNVEYQGKSFFDGSDVYEKTELKYQSDIKELQQNIQELQRKLRYSFGSRLLSKVNRMISKL